ncbi:hypothetical protein BGZ61DRAFT_469844 [Ilyonectria robusta]|uniref:uncharacterized protein n=1 Tax=Ilyonectria robusta TaxID=1079257 RepID=UPI001E8D2728|nr:uncharacterized protein BGZ61DRAFT_469844 [Ilyonectria robusta]KAH8647630.1 hypothetical protein BGZ61DRAFT_469844 [Ilyonectria robusta]
MRSGKPFVAPHRRSHRYLSYISRLLAIMAYSQYSVEDEISIFFAKTSTTRPDCDVRAEELVSGKATRVDV